MFREEELLTNVAPLPVLSARLRSRVLAAAGAARARRSHARRVLASGLVLFCLLGWVSWTYPPSLVAKNSVAADLGMFDGSSFGSSTTGNTPAASTSYCRRDMLISAMGDDWRMVEAEFKSREEFTRRAQM